MVDLAHYDLRRPPDEMSSALTTMKEQAGPLQITNVE